MEFSVLVDTYSLNPLISLTSLNFLSKSRRLLTGTTYPYARPNFLSEEVRFGAKSKLTRMGVYLAYIPIRGNEFGAEDDLLSQDDYQDSTT